MKCNYAPEANSNREKWHTYYLIWNRLAGLTHSGPNWNERLISKVIQCASQVKMKEDVSSSLVGFVVCFFCFFFVCTERMHLSSYPISTRGWKQLPLYLDIRRQSQRDSNQGSNYKGTRVKQEKTKVLADLCKTGRPLWEMWKYLNELTGGLSSQTWQSFTSKLISLSVSISLK